MFSLNIRKSVKLKKSLVSFWVFSIDYSLNKFLPILCLLSSMFTVGAKMAILNCAVEE